MDIKKLKYDLAMQCTLIEMLKDENIDSQQDLRRIMLEKFISHYEFYQILHESNFYGVDKLDS